MNWALRLAAWTQLNAAKILNIFCHKNKCQIKISENISYEYVSNIWVSLLPFCHLFQYLRHQYRPVIKIIKLTYIRNRTINRRELKGCLCTYKRTKYNATHIMYGVGLCVDTTAEQTADSCEHEMFKVSRVQRLTLCC